MKRYLINIIVVGLLVVGLLGCSETNTCMKTGGYENSDGICVCDVNLNSDTCIQRYSELLRDSKNPEYVLRLDYTGNDKSVSLNNVTDETATLENRSTDYIIISEKIGFAVSIPDNPQQKSENWEFRNCQFTRTETQSPISNASKVQYSFKSTCENSGISTEYWTTRSLNLVAIRFVSVPSDALVPQNLELTNIWFDG